MSSGTGTGTTRRSDRQPVGIPLRNRRKELGLTLQAVADGAGLSVGFISQVERDLTSPSLTSLLAIARVLDIGVADILVAPGGESPMTRQFRRPVYGPDPEIFGYERISANFSGHVLSGVIIHESPGYRSEPIRHEGEELFYMLEGSITVEIDGECTVLHPGDSIHFDSMRRHSTWNHTLSPARILHVCTIDVFGDRQDEPATDEPATTGSHRSPRPQDAAAPTSRSRRSGRTG
ncbi:MAG: XRE family transcriptional regulator [Paracoccaceae bacterium]|nr:XRE family transcriptional regulator [Paracoccaceae bacterium]MDE2914526.1 XRE family transcriptional regulator [Paracoccaceae bacterium]